jgi:transcriptional regulator of heat shock response
LSSTKYENKRAKQVLFGSGGKREAHTMYTHVSKCKNDDLKRKENILRKRLKDLSCSCASKINIVKMINLPKAIYRFNAIHINILMPFFTKKQKKILKLT